MGRCYNGSNAYRICFGLLTAEILAGPSLRQTWPELESTRSRHPTAALRRGLGTAGRLLLLRPEDGTEPAR